MMGRSQRDDSSGLWVVGYGWWVSKLRILWLRECARKTDRRYREARDIF